MLFAFTNDATATAAFCNLQGAGQVDHQESMHVEPLGILQGKLREVFARVEYHVGGRPFSSRAGYHSARCRGGQGNCEQVVLKSGERERESSGLNSSKSWLSIFFTPHVNVYVRITNV